MESWLWLCLVLVASLDFVYSRPRYLRQVDTNDNFSFVNTTFGPIQGKRFVVDSTQALEIYLGIPYARPPTGDFRWSRPVPPDVWTQTRNATVHGAKCIQRIIPQDPPLENVPFDEDCLFVDVYTLRFQNGSKTPTMMFLHGGGYYGGSGALYNFTNVALRGVTVVTVSYRLDIFGFLSTLDAVIPGNFGLMDQALALDWVKSNIALFGGDPDSITIFGGSSGAISSSLFLISPLTQGKFHKAIMQSGAASCNWSHHSNLETAFDYPVTIAKQFGQLMNCTLPQQNFSRQLLDCLRKLPAEVIINQSVALQEITYKGNSLFYPVIEQTFGFLPDTPSKLLEKMDPKYYVPSIYGYTREDGSWLVNDAENDGVSVEEFTATLKLGVEFLYKPTDQQPLMTKALATYLPKNTSNVSKLELRDRLVRAMTDLFFMGCSVHEAKQMASKTQSSKTYIYEFAYRPSFSNNPEWMGVAHADEKGFVLGLPVGPDPFKYPVHNDDDKYVSNFIVSSWTNFAKFGNPIPQNSGMKLWPPIESNKREFNLMEIKKEPNVTQFARQEALDVWIIDGGNINSASNCIKNKLFISVLLIVLVFIK